MLSNSVGVEGMNRSRPIMADDLFELSQVNVHFENRTALSQINFKIKKGEMLLITGPSGAGKTTLLKILSGTLAPSSGKVSLLDPDVFCTEVFQDLKLAQELSIKDNLEFSFDPLVYKSKEEFNSDLVELSKVLGVSEFLDLSAGKANRGLLQKTAVIRALLSRPDVLLADEPTCSLDSASALRVYELLSFFNNKRKMTLIWTSHNQNLSNTFSGRSLQLEKGRMVNSRGVCIT
jgi:ABC-type multidrug transport system ATPase subunit